MHAMRNVKSGLSRRLAPLLGAAAAAVACRADQPVVTDVARAPHTATSVASTQATAVLNPTGDIYLNIDSVSYAADSQLHLYTWPNDTIANAILMKFDLTSL